MDTHSEDVARDLALIAAIFETDPRNKATLQQGAAEITRLRALVEELKADRIRINDEAEAEIKRLREALEPFSNAATAWEAGGYDSDKDQLVEHWPEASDEMLSLTLGDLRRARKALEGGE